MDVDVASELGSVTVATYSAIGIVWLILCYFFFVMYRV